jgi:hypothetical protein
MKGKATWKPVGLSASKWHGAGHGRGPVVLPPSKNLIPRQTRKSSGTKPPFTGRKP